MQNYQQYLSFSPNIQTPPLSTTSNQLKLTSPVLAFGETRIGGSLGNRNLPATGFVTVKPPISLVYHINPNNYTHGLNSSGKIIGANQEIPYPTPSIKYHDFPFIKSVDWYTTEVLGTHTFSDVMKKREAKNKQEADASFSETAEYFTAANDEGYTKWAAKKTQEQLNQVQKQAQAKVIPQEIKNLHGHVNPTITETSNEAYGQYLDLRPKFPAVYPLPAKNPPQPLQVFVRFRPSNMSDSKLIPDHAFAVDPREMINKDGCYNRGTEGSVYYPQGSNPQSKTAFTFRQNEVILGQTVGERSKGFTWPVYAPTSLEINRPLSRCVSVVAGVDGKKKFRTLVPARTVPYIYNRYMSYTSVPSKDSETEPNPASRQHKQMCMPFNPNPPTNPNCDPCNLNFMNPQLLPVPIELRKPPPC